MTLLGGGIAGVFARTFGALYLDGQLIRRTLTDNGAGGVTASEQAAVAIKYQLDKLTEAQRNAPDFRATDIRVIVLFNGAVIDDACVLVLNGKRYRVAPGIALDAASSHYEIRAVLE
jgi:hypothetical protein